MAAKTVAILDNDLVLRELKKKLDGLYEELDVRKKFLQKQVHDLGQWVTKEKDIFWREIEARLIELGHLPKDFNHENPNINIKIRDGAIVVMDRDDYERENRSLDITQLLKSFIKPE